MRLNGSQEEQEGQELSGVRVEQPDGKYFQVGVLLPPLGLFDFALKIKSRFIYLKTQFLILICLGW